jgi:tryptophan synthase alpha chain
VSRISSTFAVLREHNRRALIPFVMGGDPSLDATEVFLTSIAESGADLLEIGVPFSDPIADGPTNQRAAQRALANSVTLCDILDLVTRLRPKLPQPIVLLSYYNPVLRFDVDRFFARAAAAGVDGIVIPDLPAEEGGPLQTAAQPHGVDVIFLAAPTSTDARLARVAAASRGFVYCVSLTGVTGVRTALSVDIGGLVDRLRRHTPLPVCVGFGVSTPDHARQVAEVADGVIVGSAVVSLIERHGAAATPELASFVRGLRAGIDTATREHAPGAPT